MAKTKKVTQKEDEQDLQKNPVNVFCCTSCGHKDSIPFDEFKKHLSDVHGVTKDGMKGKKQMTMHMDGSYWFSSTYEWTLEGGVKFSQYVRMARSKGDFMGH